MCEHVVARAGAPFALGELWDLVRALERYGLAGWGWGAAWTTDGGGLAAHRDARAFRDDPATYGLADIETTSLLVHLRRPSRLGTIGLADTQPFLDPAGRFAFSHNGDLRDYHVLRRQYLEAGRIAGRADSEVGQRWLEDHWADHDDATFALATMHDRFDGQANLMALDADGEAYVYAGNTENLVFTYRLGSIGLASTGIYSLDRALFRFVAPRARRRRLVRPGHGVRLGPDGTPHAATRELRVVS
jgi:glutamine phosphoribosylpyrophosphate amidotransferase